MKALRPHYNRLRLELLAQQFRDEHAPGAIGFLEFDEIAEFELGLEIVARKYVRARTGKPGWLAVDGRTIVVDECFQRDDPAEYQSFLAHEIAHWALHRGYLPRRGITVEEFVAFHEGLTDELVSRLESEARHMGMALQMPERELRPVFVDMFELAADRFPSMNGAAETFVSAGIAQHFGVTQLRASRRMDRIWKHARRIARIERDAHRTIAPHSVRLAARVAAQYATESAAWGVEVIV